MDIYIYICISIIIYIHKYIYIYIYIPANYSARTTVVNVCITKYITLPLYIYAHRPGLIIPNYKWLSMARHCMGLVALSGL